MDYKAPTSGMEKKRCSFPILEPGSEDTLKFVVSSRRDMESSGNPGKVQAGRKNGSLFQPCFGRIQPVEIVDFLMEKVNDVARSSFIR